jgi:hypothetical protein
MILTCAICQAPITNPVEELSYFSALSEEDGRPHLPAGFYYVALPDDDLQRPPGDYVLNISDLKDTKRHHDRSRLNGCCGLDGCDGFNTLCANGHEVGTERSDCWLSHFVVLAAEHVVPIQ